MRIYWSILAFCSVIIIWVFFPVIQKTKLNSEAMKNPEIIAHRGASSVAPENTLASVQKGYEGGAGFIEVDVRLTADNRPVLMHDEKLDRTTNSTAFLSDLLFEDVRLLDAGSWFSDDYKGEAVPYLEEVICLIKGKAKLLIEIKDYGCIDSCVYLINKYNAFDWCWVQAFDDDVLERIHTMDTRVRLIKLLIGKWKFLPLQFDSGLNYFSFNKYSFLKGFAIHHRFAGQHFVNWAHKRNMLVFVWTLDDGRRAKKLRKRGIDGIITNNPGVMIEALKDG